MHLPYSPAYSMGFPAVKKTQNQHNDSPGPGAYQIDNRTTSPAFKMGKQKRTSQEKEHLPGPGSYLIKRDIIHSPGISFKSRHNDSRLSEDVPGPGSYQPKFQKIDKTQPSYKIHHETKMELQNTSSLPGPADYNLRNTTSTHTVKFGKSARKNIIDSNPGPGNYQTQNQLKYLLSSQPKFSFGRSKRERQNKPKSPGPGSYDLNTEFVSRSGITFKQKLEIHNTTVHNPGPGTYNTQFDKYLKNSPSYSFRALNKQTNNQKTPGPLDYSVSDVLFHRLGKVVIGKAKREVHEKNENPGPGSYANRPIIGNDGPKYSINRTDCKNTSTANSQFPGPGYYDTTRNRNDVSKKIAFGKQQRNLDLSKRRSPGPGDYNILAQKSKSYTIGSDKRQLDKQIWKSPGPGHYELGQIIGNIAKYKK